MIRRTPTSLRDRLAYQSFRNRMSAKTPDAEIQKFLDQCDEFYDFLQEQMSEFWDKQDLDTDLLKKAAEAKFGKRIIALDDRIFGDFTDDFYFSIEKMKKRFKTGDL